MSLRHPKHLLGPTRTVQKNRWGADKRSCLYADLSKLPEVFYREVLSRLAWIAERAGMPRNECADMVQEAWVRALKHSEKHPGEHTLVEIFSWLVKIVRNVVKETLRNDSLHSAQALDDSSREPMDQKEAERTHLAEMKEQLTPLLDRLQREEPENYHLVRERYLAGRKVEELAEETGLPAPVVSDHLYRTLKKMRSRALKSHRHGEKPLE